MMIDRPGVGAGVGALLCVGEALGEDVELALRVPPVCERDAVEVAVPETDADGLGVGVEVDEGRRAATSVASVRRSPDITQLSMASPPPKRAAVLSEAMKLGEYTVEPCANTPPPSIPAEQLRMVTRFSNTTEESK